MGRIHFVDEQTVGPLTQALCGWIGSRVSELHSEVTCALCLKLIADKGPDYVRALPTAHPFRMGCRTPAEAREVQPYLWPTWNAALRALVRAHDDGHALRSSSDPRRFEAMVFDRYGGGDGDAAQRQAIHLIPATKAFEEAVDEFHDNALCPTVTAVSLIVGYTCGRAASTKLTGRKTFIVMREHWDFHDMAVHHGIGVEGARAAIKAIGIPFERILYDSGHIAARTDWSRLDMAGRDDVLLGWKEIAQYLGKSIKTCMSMRDWDPPIPVIPFGTQVQITKVDLDKWRGSGPRLRASE